MASFPREIFSTKEGRGIEVRSLLGADGQNLIQFLQQAATETTHTNQYIGRVFPPVEEFAKKIEATFDDPRALHLGAFDDSTLVAIINLRPLNSDHKWIKHIASFGLIVLRNYWSTGLAQHLMSCMEQFASTTGFIKIEANVRERNLRGIRFYEKLGYLVEGRRKNAAFIDGEFQDELYIAKVLA